VALTVEKQQTGGIALMTCTGRIVEGSESALLRREVEAQLDEMPFVVLGLSGIDFIDSSGLGLLVGLLNRARLAGGDLRLCAPSPRLKEILRVTRLEKSLPPHESAAEAIAATYDHARTAHTLDRLATDILCVAQSRDVLVYLGEILRQAGFGVMSSDNLPDALMLLRAVRPKAVVIDAALRAAHSSAADAFNGLADPRIVIELPADFSHHEAGEAGIALLDRVRNVIG
jgi:anti-sigma B factor antagonist